MEEGRVEDGRGGGREGGGREGGGREDGVREGLVKRRKQVSKQWQGGRGKIGGRLQSVCLRRKESSPGIDLH